MRRINRRSVALPPIFRSASAELFRKEVQGYLQKDQFDVRPPAPPPFHRTDSELTEAFKKLFHGKCAYCESPGSEFDFFRPRSGAEERGHVDHRYYSWLAFEWGNILSACPACNRNKGNRFPVDRLGRIGSSLAMLRRYERPLLIDPSDDLPASHLALHESGQIFGSSQRGHTTVKLLDLNRHDLVVSRKHTIDVVLQLVRSALLAGRPPSSLEDIRALIADQAPFAGIARLVLLQLLPPGHSYRSWNFDNLSLNALSRLLGALSIETLSLHYHPHDPDKWDAEPGPRRFVRKVTIENFRGIESLTVEFPAKGKDDKPGSVVVVGENSAGKTCLLQACAIGAMGPDNARLSGIQPTSCLREFSTEGYIQVNFWDTEDFNRVEFSVDSSVFTGVKKVDVVVLGYGAYRLQSRGLMTANTQEDDFRVQTLFNERALVHGPFGLQRHFRKVSGELDSARIMDAVRSLNALLLSESRVLVVDQDKLAVDIHGHVQRLDRLSSGYKSVISIATDLMDVMYSVWDGMTSGQALVLIDEIDAHLHPSWRMQVVDSLRRAFPRSQFLITTHDPLVLRGLASHEVTTLERDASGKVVAEPSNSSNIEALSIDQLLTSPLFGLPTTRDPELAKDLALYYSLLSASNLSGEDVQRLDSLRADLRGRQPMGDTQRERLLYRVIDKELSRRKLTEAEQDEDFVDYLLSELDAAEKEVFEP